MRLRGLAVHRFRGMSPLELDLDAPLVVVEGPNEAGKSSLIAFLEALLFPTSTPAQTQVDGRLDLSTEGTNYRLERTGGRPTHRLTDRFTGEVLDLAHLADLTGNLGAGVYRNVFAFGQAELQALNALDEAAVKERLYSAAVAGAGRNAGSASRKLEERAFALLRPRSASTVLAGLAAELNELDEAVRKARSEARSYADLQSERERAAQHADESSRLQQAAAERRAWLENVLRVWPAWQARAAATAGLEEVAAEEALLEVAEDGGPAPAAWLRLAGRVSGLEADLGAHQQTQSEVSSRLSELSKHVETLRAGLRNLGPGWTAGRLTTFDGGAEWRARAAAMAAALREADEARARLQGAREGARQAVAAAIDRAEDRRLELDRKLADTARQLAPGALEGEGDVGPRLADQRSEVVARLDLLTKLEDLTADLALVNNRRAGTLEQLQAAANAQQVGRRRRWLGWGIVLAGTGGAAWLAWPEDRTLALVAVALGAAAAAFLWPRPRRAAAEGVLPVAELEVRLNDLRAEGLGLEAAIEDARVALGLSENGAMEAGNAELRSAERRATAQAAALDAALGALEGLDAAEREVDRSRRALEDHERRAEQHEAARNGALGEWQAWCESVGVGEGTAPAAIADVVNEVERLKAVQAAFNDVNAKLRPALERADEFRARVSAVAAELRLDPTGDDVADTVRDWAARLRASAEKTNGLAEERHRLEAQVAAADLELRTRFGAEAAQAAAQLNEGTPVGWNSELTEATEQERRYAEAAKEHQERTGRLQQALTQLAASNALAMNLEAADRVATEAHAQARRWLVARIAKTLIDDTLREYERDKVPGVLRRAGDHLRTMTNGAYVRVHFNEDDGLRIFTPHEAPKATQELSRGTHEQLYLAVRLGLIESFAEANVALPLVLDDVLVNADPERAERMVRVLAQVAEQQQLLFLTCHPHLARLVMNQAAEAKHVRLPPVAQAGGRT